MGPGHVVSKIRLMDQQSPARVDKVATGLEKGPARAPLGPRELRDIGEFQGYETSINGYSSLNTKFRIR
jgi:hypothetical protein